MTEQQTHAPQPISDEELDAATGGAVGVNPLLLLNAGAQGIYHVGPEPAPAPVAPGSNPLYVDNASHNTTPVYTPTHDVAPTPTAAPVSHDVAPTPTAAPVSHDVAPAPTPASLSSVLNSVAAAHTAIAHQIPPQFTTTAVTHDVVPTPQPTVVQHDSTPLVIASSGLGNSLNIAPPVSTPPMVIVGTLNSSISNLITQPTEDTSQVSIMTFNTTPSYSTVTPTVHGLRSAIDGDKGAPTTLAETFNLHLTK